MQVSTEVEARFGEGGKVTLVSFTWHGQRHRVTSQGRQWQADDGQHFLVMTAGDRIFELRYAAASGSWHVLDGPKSLMAA